MNVPALPEGWKLVRVLNDSKKAQSGLFSNGIAECVTEDGRHEAILKWSDDSHYSNLVRREAGILAKLSPLSKHIIQPAFGMTVETCHGPTVGGGYFLMVEKMPHVVLSYLHSFTSEHVQTLVIQIHDALCAVHGAGYVHLDVHPGNIGFSKDRSRFVLFDFDVCYPQSMEASVVGTRRYRSPRLEYAEHFLPEMDFDTLALTVLDVAEDLADESRQTLLDKPGTIRLVWKHLKRVLIDVNIQTIVSRMSSEASPSTPPHGTGTTVAAEPDSTERSLTTKKLVDLDARLRATGWVGIEVYDLPNISRAFAHRLAGISPQDIVKLIASYAILLKIHGHGHAPSRPAWFARRTRSLYDLIVFSLWATLPRTEEQAAAEPFHVPLFEGDRFRVGDAVNMFNRIHAWRLTLDTVIGRDDEETPTQHFVNHVLNQDWPLGGEFNLAEFTDAVRAHYQNMHVVELRPTDETQAAYVKELLGFVGE